MRRNQPHRTYKKTFKGTNLSTEYLPVKTRTGKEIHLASGSVTLCGVWMRMSAHLRYVDHAYTCEKCKEIYEKDIENA